jgi:hypothetical protein
MIDLGPNGHPPGFNGTFSWAKRQVAYKNSEICHHGQGPAPRSSVATFRRASRLRFTTSLGRIQLSLRQRLATRVFALNPDELGNRHLQLLGQLEERLQAWIPLATLEPRQQSKREGCLGQILLGHSRGPAGLADGVPDAPEKMGKIHAPRRLERRVSKHTTRRQFLSLPPNHVPANLRDRAVLKLGRE